MREFGRKDAAVVVAELGELAELGVFAELQAASDHGLLVRFSFPDGTHFDEVGVDEEWEPAGAAAIADAAGRLSARLIARLAGALLDAQLTGVTDVVPAYSTVLVRYEPRAVEAEDLAQEVRRVVAAVINWHRHRHRHQHQGQQLAQGARSDPERRVELPVCYGGEHGPDLAEVAHRLGMSPSELIARHAAARYRVVFFGFAPGFGYLSGLPRELHVPRLATPRPRIPAGSVAIAGAQAGVYPLAGPGGWQLLGRTALPLVRLTAEPWTRLQLGDEVRFVPVERVSDDSEDPKALGTETQPRGESAMEVLSAGALTTVQDLGRPGWARLGISAGGAADPVALRLGNRLVGNRDGAAALELTLLGPELRARTALTAALVGPVAATLDGHPVPSGETLRIAPGQILRCGSLQAQGGARAYLCLRGGLAVPTVCSSAATDVRGRFGGRAGRGLKRGDLLDLGLDEGAPPSVQRLTAEGRELLGTRRRLRVVWGAQADWFSEAVREQLTRLPLSVTPQADRTGIRLRATEPLLPRDPTRQLLTEGLSAGAVQVPPDGQPILVGVEHQTTGGYPKLAQIVSADLPQLGRLRPGDTIHLVPISHDEARDLLRTEARLLAAAIAAPCPPSHGELL